MMKDTLEPRYEAIAGKLKAAVLEHRPVIIRHHADTDGISAGIVLEKALTGLILDKGRKIGRYIVKRQSQSPYYDTSDCLKDLNLISRFMLPKVPLLLLLDIGSTDDDQLALQMFRSFGFEAVVVDHHPPHKDMDTDVYHCNPHLVGKEGVTTSMMAYEVASRIDGEADVMWAALGGVGDKTIDEDYLRASGKTLDELTEIKVCLDYIGYKMLDSGSYVYERIVQEPGIRHVIVKHLDIPNKIDKLMGSLKTEEDSNFRIAHLDLENRGFDYPSPGKTCGFIFDRLDTGKDFILLGFYNNSLIIRQSKPVVKLEILKAKINQLGFAQGGGHDLAGTLKFHSVAKDAILGIVRKMVKQS